MRTVCSTRGCTALAVTRGRCQQHARQVDAERGTNGQRGYDAEHRRLRRLWAPLVHAAVVLCWRCGQIINNETWDLGHDDLDRSKYVGPEHAACNRAVKAHTVEETYPQLRRAVTVIGQRLLQGEPFSVDLVGHFLRAAAAQDRAGLPPAAGPASSAPPS